ncbi:MAG TPA: alkaline phosphatase family protein, partial [Phycisphaerae bacterium]|nr:alkaline phosphatase family protein [Phycisphaerae bacterium]
MRFQKACRLIALTAALPLSMRAATAQTIGPVFVIAMENHNWTQPAGQSSPEQIYGNPAAPFINSLVTPGNSNAQYVSYASNYQNAGFGIHPSEPNYVWAEGGSNFGNATDADPSPDEGNIYDTPHITRLLNTAGVTWKNYQEDVEVSGDGPMYSAGGTLPGGAHNFYNGSTQYDYAPKHNPMVFYSDTQTQNLAPLSELSIDLSANNVASYN